MDFWSVPEKISCQFSGILFANAWLNGKAGGICQLPVRICKQRRSLVAKKQGNIPRNIFPILLKNFFIIFPIVSGQTRHSKTLPEYRYNPGWRKLQGKSIFLSCISNLLCWLVRFDVVDLERIQVSVQIIFEFCDYSCFHLRFKGIKKGGHSDECPLQAYHSQQNA